MITFTVPGQPQGKGRARVVKIGGFTRLATPQKTVIYEGLIAHAAMTALAGRPMFTGAVSCNIWIDCQIPASWSNEKKRNADFGQVMPATRPDIDNVVKAIFDGLNGALWRDDSQVVDMTVRKRYALTPCVKVFARELP